MSNSVVEWIERATEPQAPYRAFVVGWQNSISAVSRQIKSYNALTIPKRPLEGHDEMDVAAVRRHIVSCLVELKATLDDRYGVFRKDGLPTTSIDHVRNARRRDLDSVERWRDIRNLTFHFADVMRPRDELVTTYQSILEIKDEEVNCAWEAIVDVGQAMKLVASERT